MPVRGNGRESKKKSIISVEIKSYLFLIFSLGGL